MILIWIFHPFPMQTQEPLTVLSEPEVKVALFQIVPNKAPRLDGLSVAFFQRNWNVISKEVFNFEKQVFETRSFPRGMNKMLISFIPKQDYPEKISHFRPVALCNVVVKLITKIIANRIKPLMTKLVREDRVSFIPGRQGIDNMIIVQEMIMG